MKKLLIIIYFGIVTNISAQAPLKITPVQIANLEIPALKKGETVIKHKAYSLSYNEEYEQANWVAYELTAEETQGNFKRTNKFIEDPLVSTGTADNKDYLHSDLDRGHLAPAGDMGWSAQSMAESFYYSNMSPQVPTFNRGIWENGEELQRAWAVENKSIYIVVGPVLTKGLPTIGPNKVAIPKYYFKVILDYNSPSIKGIGLLIPNGESSRSLKSFFVSIDSVEKFTGIDFFPGLPDDQEKLIESNVNLNEWSWGSSESKIKPSSENTIKTTKKAPNSEMASVQCIMVTKSGSRCKKMTKNTNHRCSTHQ
jgi:endonuclease G